MPLDIQSGTLVEKLRRSLGIRGRAPLRLDETVVPIVLTAQLDQSPFRSPIDAFTVATYGDAAAAVGAFGFTGIQLPASLPGALVLHGTLLMNSVAADTYALWLGNSIDYDAIRTGAPIQSSVNTEFYPSNPVATSAPFRTPWGGNMYGTNAVQGVGLRVMLARLPIDQSIYIPLHVTLRPGWGIAWWRGTVNQPCNANFFGTYYPNAAPTT